MFEELEETCERCNGTGQVPFKNYYLNCQRCVNGKNLSEKGQALLDFLGRWGLNELRNAVDSYHERIHSLEHS